MKNFFWSKIAIYLCPRYKRSLQPSKANIQLVLRIRIRDPVPFCVWNRDGSERRHSFVKYFETTTNQNLSLNQSIPCNSLNFSIPTKGVDSNVRTWCWLAISATAPPLLLPHEAGGGAAAALLLPQDATLLLPHGGAALFLSVDEGGGGGGTAIHQLHLFLLLMLGCNCGL